MNSERLFKIIISDLTSEKMKNEEELERIINLDMETDVKILTIKNILKQISLTELSIAKFSGMLTVNNNNNNTKI
jgi:hypothetical protein